MSSKIKRILEYSPTIAAVFIALAAAYRPISRNKDLLEDYSLITRDGFQWIIQGRAFSNGLFSEPWPELRNPGYVFVTALDNLFGAAGYVISLSIAVSLLVQIFVIHYISFQLLKSRLLAGIIALAVILSPIQFISIHVLSDASSVALMFLIILQIFKVLYLEKKINLFYFFILTLITPLFQLYTIYPLIVLIILTIYVRFRYPKNNSHSYLIKISLYGFLGLLLGVIIRQTWYASIPHESVPNQFSLINFNFENFYFYLNTWTWLIGPTIVLSLLIIAFIKLRNFNIFTVYIFSLFTFYAISIFFYSWQESRFSYFLTILSFIVFTLCVSLLKSNNIKSLISISLAALVFIFGSVFTPTDKWSPTVGESVMFRPWILHGFWGSPAYTEYTSARNLYCLADVIQVEVTDKLIEETMPIIYRSDLQLAKFALKNCL